MSTKNLEHIRHIIFDIDGTLCMENSWFKITKELGADPWVHRWLYYEFKHKRISYVEFVNWVLKLWKDTGNANIEYMSRMIESWVLDEEVVKTITFLSANRELCLISSAVDLFVGSVAKKLSIKKWFANAKLVFDEQGQLVKIEWDPRESALKVKQFFQYLLEYPEHSWDVCAFVGNGIDDDETDETGNDFDMFQLMTGIAINAKPSERLDALAYCVIDRIDELCMLFAHSQN